MSGDGATWIVSVYGGDGDAAEERLRERAELLADMRALDSDTGQPLRVFLVRTGDPGGPIEDGAVELHGPVEAPREIHSLQVSVRENSKKRFLILQSEDDIVAERFVKTKPPHADERLLRKLSETLRDLGVGEEDRAALRAAARQALSGGERTAVTLGTPLTLNPVGTGLTAYTGVAQGDGAAWWGVELEDEIATGRFRAWGHWPGENEHAGNAGAGWVCAHTGLPFTVQDSAEKPIPGGLREARRLADTARTGVWKGNRRSVPDPQAVRVLEAVRGRGVDGGTWWALERDGEVTVFTPAGELARWHTDDDGTGPW